MRSDSGLLPLVSVVIPTRNRPEVVCRAARSALAQTYSNLEVVVVVDGPDPSTVTALSRLNDPRMRIVALEENVGGSEARNIGVRESLGEWVALLDDDDEWLPKKIERQLQLSVRRLTKGTVISFCKYIYRRQGKRDQIWPLRLPGKEPMSEFMFDHCSGFQTSTFFIPREYLMLHPFKKGLRGHQDWDWLLHVSSDPSVEMAIDPQPQSIFHVIPEIKRASYGFDWRESLQWGQENRDNMTPKAYSRFIAYHCARLAVGEQARSKSLMPLARECFLKGKPTAMTIAIFFLMYLMSPRARRALHDCAVRQSRNERG